MRSNVNHVCEACGSTVLAGLDFHTVSAFSVPLQKDICTNCLTKILKVMCPSSVMLSSTEATTFQIVEDTQCECGSDKAKIPTHSSWCPKAVI